MPTFNFYYDSTYSTKITFETQVNSRALGGEQRYPKKQYPIREFTLTFNKDQIGREALMDFYASVLGAEGVFTFTWATDKGGNGKTYTNCYFKEDIFKQTITYMGYGENVQLSFYCIDRNAYTADELFAPYYKEAQYDLETQFNTIKDKVITASQTKRGLWTTPKKRWELTFEKTKASREALEAFFIAKRGKWKSFEWIWEESKGGDGQTYNVRFDIDELEFNIKEMGYSDFKIPLQEVLQTTTEIEYEKDEIIPRKLLEVSIETGSVRILENDTLEVLSYGGQDYIGAPLEIDNITHDNTNEVLKVGVTLSNVSQQFSGIIGTSGDIVTNAKVNLYIVFLDTSTGEIISGLDEILLYGKANDIELTLETAKFNIEVDLGGFENQVPRMHYGVACQWIKFKDVNCAYAGSVTTCDRTVTTCKRLGNIENYGGMPNAPFESVIKA